MKPSIAFPRADCEISGKLFCFSVGVAWGELGGELGGEPGGSPGGSLGASRGEFGGKFGGNEGDLRMLGLLLPAGEGAAWASLCDPHRRADACSSAGEMSHSSNDACSKRSGKGMLSRGNGSPDVDRSDGSNIQPSADGDSVSMDPGIDPGMDPGAPPSSGKLSNSPPSLFGGSDDAWGVRGMRYGGESMVNKKSDQAAYPHTDLPRRPL